MEFSPNNKIVKLCVQGIGLEEKDKHGDAGRIFLHAWNEASDDFEKFMTAFFVARNQENISERLKWFETSLEYATKINDVTVNSAFPSLYSSIAKCHEELGESLEAKEYHDLAASLKDKLSDNGPFYHGTKADLKVGDLLTAGSRSNYKPDLIMNHIYFTASVNGAGLAAALAKGEGPERVYIVEPTGSFENDPNVTDKKFPGNPTRSYRTTEPLKIVGEVKEWARQTPGELRSWREKLDKLEGDIIN